MIFLLNHSIENMKTFFQNTFTISFFILIFYPFYFVKAQNSIQLDSTIVLGLETKNTIFKTPAAVHKITKADIDRLYTFSPSTVFNSVAGVRLEERSPGSYRIAIRGSSLRSPFGVRNIKMYWNGIPFSDANGLSYFNLLDMQSMGNIEILRGPASSIYGSGYGGVVAMSSLSAPAGKSIASDVSVGSFGTFQSALTYTAASAKSNTAISISNLQSEGYRDHTALNRYVLNLKQEFFSPKNHISIFGLVSKLNYETPGGLTLEQKNIKAKAARATAADQKAGIIQTTSLFGISDNFQISKNLNLESALFFSKTDLENPALTNYEKRKEQSLGLRFALSKTIKCLKLWLGTEAQKTDSEFNVFTNTLGKPAAARYSDNVVSNNAFVFSQAKWSLPADFALEAGLSINSQKFDIIRKGIQSTVKSYAFLNKPDMPPTARVSLSKIFSQKLALYARWSTGLSAPIASEVVSTLQNGPNSSILSAEKAENLEFGLKYNHKNTNAEIIAFNQKIKNGLKRNVNAAEAEFFTNLTLIKQSGLEMSLNQKFRIANAPNQIRVNAAIYDFKNGTKALPGIAPNNISIIHFIDFNPFLSLVADLNYLSAMPLLDDNSVKSKSQSLLNSKLIFQKTDQNLTLKIKAGIDNILKADYSAGYDFNAALARYYNPAPGLNFNGGISLSFKIR
jgi:iron complex outermembrane recepter protein